MPGTRKETVLIDKTEKTCNDLAKQLINHGDEIERKAAKIMKRKGKEGDHGSTSSKSRRKR